MFQTDHASGKASVPTPAFAGEMVSYRAAYAIAAADIAQDVVIEAGILPAGCELVDTILDSDDLDTNVTPTITLDVGIMSGTAGSVDDARTVGTELFSASTVAQAGGLARPTAKGAVRIAADDEDRGIGIKIKADAATAAAGTIGLTLIYRG